MSDQSPGPNQDPKLTREQRERARREADARPAGRSKGQKKDDKKRKKGK
jgi:hypothetical protein